MRTKKILCVLFAHLALLNFGSLFSQFDLSVCTIFQNEAPFLKEWIEFHKLQGVQHFYLYNNNSEDDYLSVLEPYILKQEATLVQWSYTYEEGNHDQWIKIQTDAYMHCIKNHKEDSRWIAFIDADEFLFCPQGEKLPEFLKDYSAFGGLCVNWIKFGTSNVADIPPGSCMIELLTQSAKPEDPDNRFIKSIVQPRFVKGCISPHWFKFAKSKYSVDVDKKRQPEDTLSRHIKLDRIRINHYWTRTVNWFLEYKLDSKKKRRAERPVQKLIERAEKCNLSSDTAILKYVNPLREAMGFNDQ